MALEKLEGNQLNLEVCKINSKNSFRISNLYLVMIYALLVVLLKPLGDYSIYLLLLCGLLSGFNDFTVILFPVLCYCNFFSLYSGPSSELVVTDCALLTIVVFFARCLIKREDFIISKKNYVFILILLLYFSLAIVAMVNIDQSFIRSVLSFRKYLILLLFPISYYLIDRQRISLDTLIHTLKIICIVSCFFITIQFFVGVDNLIFDVTTATREGRERILTHTSLLLTLFLCFHSIYEIIKSKRINLRNALCIVFPLLVLFVVSVTRIYILAFTAMIISFIALHLIKQIRKKDRIFVTIFCTLGILAIVVFTFIFLYNLNETFRSFWEDIFSDDYIRIKEIKYFTGLLDFPNNIFGFGLINSKSDFYILASEQGCYLSDIGLIGYILNYGIIGVIILIAYFALILRHIINNTNNKLSVFFWSYLVGFIITMATVYPFEIETFSAYFIFINVLFISSKKCIECDKREINYET